MVVPLSGQIAMNRIHINAGGSSGSQVGMNDSDVRALANDFSGQIDFAQTRGGVTITQGTSGSVKGYSDGQVGGGSSYAYGSITQKGNVNGANVIAVYYSEFTIKGNTTRIFFVFMNGYRNKSHFTSIYESSIGTLTTASSSHSHSTSGGVGDPYTMWTWNPTSTPANWDGSGALKLKFQ